jgi:hypothetical protein
MVPAQGRELPPLIYLKSNNGKAKNQREICNHPATWRALLQGILLGEGQSQNKRYQEGK